MTFNLEASGYVKIAECRSISSKAILRELEHADLRYVPYRLAKEDNLYEVWIQKDDMVKALRYFAEAYCEDAYNGYLELVSRGET